MKNRFAPPTGAINPARRRFVQGLAAGGVFAGLGLRPNTGLAAFNPNNGQHNGPATLRGTVFDLSIGQQGVNFTGSPAMATTVNGSLPAPTLRWRQGDRVTLRVTNTLPVDSSIHWHGVILPSRMDGVPHISDDFKGIAPGQTFTYQFDVKQYGTYWYHSHSGFQEQTGLYGAIIIDPAGPDYRVDRDYVIQLSDWSDEQPERIYAKLKKLSDYYNGRERTAGDLFRQIKAQGVERTFANRQMWNEMRMSDRDISDVTGMTYTFLMNGQTPADGWTGMFKKGERVRLRIINSSAMTFFDVRIPGMKMTVVASDGQDIEPISVDEFRIGVAETYDVLVEPKDDTAYTIFAQAIDRSGYARGTLTPDPALRAEVPPMDAAPILGHMDMGMDMSGMDMGGMAGMNHGGNDMASMGQTAQAGMAMDHSGGDMAGMNMAKPTHKPGAAGYGSAQPIVHAASEHGPQVDMLADAPMDRLDDPGIGLRGNGRAVLTYADLKNRVKTPDPREPSREIQLHLTGNMARYMWSINGIKFADAEPLHLKYGERVRVTLVNDTMMNHPIHLHGMWSDLETGDPDHIPRKHTIIVQPGSKVSYLVTADAMGGWAYHCHLLYHMLGMFRHVIVS
jgi:CopA family copper-resistance protein